MSSEQTEDRSPAAVKLHKGGIAYPFKVAARSIIRIIPGGKSSIEPAIRDLRLRFRRWQWARKAQNGVVDENENLIALDPARIEFCPKTEFAYRLFKGAAQPGDWDQSDKRFDRLAVYQAFNEVCKQKAKSWSETDYYKTILASIENGQGKYSCETQADLDARCEKLTALYESIATEGYKSQAELNTTFDDEVAVAVSRDGQFLFADGAHRLAIAKVLGLTEIPVLVSVRHPDWLAFKSQLQEFTKTQTLGTLYQQASHPDLMSVPAEHGSADRFAVIEAHLPETRGKMVDIGTNLGYMCHRFEEKGFDCIGTEIDETHLYFLRKLRDYSNRRFEVRAGSFLTDMELTTNDFEVVLGLNIFHHFLKTEEDYKLLIAFLDRLKVNYMFFEAHLPDEEQMLNAYKNYPAEEFCDFIMEHTGLTRKERIFQAHDGREMFLLSR